MRHDRALSALAPSRPRLPEAPAPVPHASSKLQALWPTIAVALSALVYGPILKNYFFDDDFLHLYNLANNGVVRFLFTPHGGHVLVLRNLIFYASYRVFGLAPLGYFVVVLLTHLANVYLLFLVIRHVTGNAPLASVGAALWGVLPANEGSLGWYSVYGHVLVTAIGLWLLYDLLQVAELRRSVSHLRLVVWCVLLLAGMTCFGVGIALAMSFTAVAYVLLADSPERKKVTAVLSSLTICVPVIYVGLYHLYAVISGDRATEPITFWRLVLDWRLNAAMLGELLVYGASSLIVPHPCSADGGSLLCYAFPAVCAAGVATLFACRAGRIRRTLVALVVLLGATYGIIAAGRALLMAAWLHQTMAQASAQPRYHYLGPALMSVILCLLLREVSRFIFTSWLRRVAPAVGLCAVLVAQVVTHPAINHHAAARAEVQSVFDTLNSLARQVPDGADICIRNRRFKGIGSLVGPASFPGWAAVFAITHPLNTIGGRTVHFIEADPQVRLAAQANPKKRAAGLLVSPDRLPPGCRVF